MRLGAEHPIPCLILLKHGTGCSAPDRRPRFQTEAGIPAVVLDLSPRYYSPLARIRDPFVPSLGSSATVRAPQFYWMLSSDVFVSVRQTIIHLVGRGKKD